MMRVTNRLLPFALTCILFTGCAFNLKNSIRETFDAAQAVSVGGDEVIRSVCIELAGHCIQEGKRRDQCGPFLQCEKAHFIFLNASKAATTALSLAEAARVAGDTGRAQELFNAAQRALEVARNIVSQFIGVDEEVQ